MSETNLLLYLIIGILSIFMITTLIFRVVVTVRMRRIKNQLDEVSRILYLSLKKERQSETRMTDIETQLSEVLSGIGSLSSSTAGLIKEVNKNNTMKIWPTPQIAELVVSTIRDQISTEITLSNNMKIPNNNSVRKIIDITVATFPNVEEEYITRRVFAEIENLGRQQNSG